MPPSKLYLLNDNFKEVRQQALQFALANKKQFPIIKTDEKSRIWLSWNTKFDTLEAVDIDDRVKDKIVIFVEKGKIAKHGIETIRKVCYKNIEKHLK